MSKIHDMTEPKITGEGTTLRGLSRGEHDLLGHYVIIHRITQTPK
jgi:hypothetical protein